MPAISQQSSRLPSPLHQNPAPSPASRPPAPPADRAHSHTPQSPKQRGEDRRGIGHGMLEAHHVANRWLVALRHILVVLISKLPGSRFKSTITRRLLGIRMGRDVGLAYGVYLDPYSPSMISFGDNVIVGYGTRIFVHAFTLTRQRVRPVTIGSNVMIGADCLIAPGVTIGDNASIAPRTVVGRNVPPGAMAYGNPMQLRKRPAQTAAST